MSVRGIWPSVGDDPVARRTIAGSGDHRSAISQPSAAAAARASRARIGERRNKNGPIPLIFQSEALRERGQAPSVSAAEFGHRLAMTP